MNEHQQQRDGGELGAGDGGGAERQLEPQGDGSASDEATTAQRTPTMACAGTSLSPEAVRRGVAPTAITAVGV